MFKSSRFTPISEILGEGFEGQGKPFHLLKLLYTKVIFIIYYTYKYKFMAQAHRLSPVSYKTLTCKEYNAQPFNFHFTHVMYSKTSIIQTDFTDFRFYRQCLMALPHHINGNCKSHCSDISQLLSAILVLKHCSYNLICALKLLF